MARKKKDNIEQNEQNDIQIKEVVKKQEKNNKQNKDIIIPDIVIRDSRTLEQKLQSYKRKLRRI